VHEGADRVRTDLGEFDVFDWGDDVITLRGAESGRYLTVTGEGTLAVTATPADPARPAWVRFKALHPERAGVSVFRIACSGSSDGRVEVWLTHPGDGKSPLASVCVPCTGGRYEWTETSAPVPLPPDADEVYLALHGPVRLDWFRL